MKAKKIVTPKVKPTAKPLEGKRPSAEKPLKLNMTFLQALKAIARGGLTKKG
jgi:hypothetical protein